MIVLNGTTESLQAVLSTSVATTQPTAVTSYADTPGTGAGDNAIALNGTTPVTIAAAPASATQRVVRYLSIYNGDSAAVTVTINKTVSAVNFPLVKVRLLSGYTLTYTGNSGWQVTDANGVLQSGNSATPAIPTDYITGLKMVWNSATSLSVSTGSAYIPSLGRLSTVNSAATASGLSLTASTWYHVYLFESAGVPSIEVVTTAPSTPYQGNARTKTGDTSRRYVGSVKTDGSGNVLKFSQTDNYISYLENVIVAPFIILNNGNATTPTNVDASGVVPITSVLANAQLFNNTTNTTCTVANADCNFTLASSVALYAVTAGLTTVALVQLASNQSMNYMHTPAPAANGMIIRIIGYVYQR